MSFLVRQGELRILPDRTDLDERRDGAKTFSRTEVRENLVNRNHGAVQKLWCMPIS